MVSMLGFAVQAAVTQEGPFANWSKHLADPFGYNLFSAFPSRPHFSPLLTDRPARSLPSHPPRRFGGTRAHPVRCCAAGAPLGC
jgi:hypothetical protein